MYKIDLSPEVNRFVESILVVCKSPNIEMSAYKNIPMEYLPQVRAYFKSQDKKIRIRYRGPRMNPGDYRDHARRMQDCIVKFANRFSVYYY